MKTIFKKTSNWTTIDTFNTKMADPLKDLDNKTMTVQKIAIGVDIDQDGTEVNAAAFVCDEGAYATISSTAIELADTLADLIDEGSYPNGIKVRVLLKKANNGRDYIVLRIAE